MPAGDTPEQVVARQEWEHRAGWAAAYRELVGHTDEHDPLGAAPGKGRVEYAVLFRAAHEALALIEAGDEEANMSDGQLRARVRAYERELNWAPRYVADELDATRQRAAKVEANAVLWAARADSPGTACADSARLRTEAAAARAEAAQLAERIAELELVDQARDRWYAHTAVTRDNSERARAELKARGVDPDCTDDRVTAAEWLDAHCADQADDDAHRAIRGEHELHDARQDVEPPDIERDNHITGPAPDLRDLGTADFTEACDPTQRRRVPTIDETTAAVARAQEALANIDARQANDEARAEQDAADRAAAEATRREELAHWAAHDESGADGRAAREQDTARTHEDAAAPVPH